MSIKNVLSIVVGRLLIYFFIAAFIYFFVPYGGHFPYKDVIQDFKLPAWIYSLANFDGAHYIHIALQGYHQYDQAFFPGYIVLIWVIGALVAKNYLISGLIISNMAFIGAVWMFHKLFTELYGKKSASWSTLLLLSIPTSFFFQAVYTESLFLFLTVGALYFLAKKQPIPAALFALVSSVVRLQGVFLVIPFIAYAYLYLNKKSLGSYLFALTPGIGLGVYMVYLWHTTGDPLFFFTSQPEFGAQRSTHLISIFQVYFRYIKIFVYSQLNYQYFIAVLEFFTASVALCAIGIHGWLSYKKSDIFNLSIAGYSLVQIIIPALTGTFSSMPRYALFVLSLYYVFSRIPIPRVKAALISLSVVLQILLFGLFIQGYFVA